MAAHSREVIVGVVGRAHGVRGEATVEVRTDEPELRFAPGVVLRAEPGSPARSAGPGRASDILLTVEAVRWHSGRLLVKFRGVPDRTAIEAMRGLVLVTDVDPNQRPEHHDEYYDHQLIGLQAQLRSHETSGSDQTGSALGSGSAVGAGASVGVVADVIHLPQQDLLQIRTAAGEERLVPFVRDLVPAVDLATGVVWLVDRPGLLRDIDD